MASLHYSRLARLTTPLRNTPVATVSMKGCLQHTFGKANFGKWNGRYYEVLAPEIIRDRVYAFLDGSQRPTKEGEERFKPTPKLVSDVFDALKAGLVLPAKHQPPMWLDTGKPANDVFVFRNGLVNLRSGDTIELTPKLSWSIPPLITITISTPSVPCGSSS